ncbi:hypothetical protein IJ118_02995 [Candidatus Saccharibacteria bacterium]|nr:hypothetical protein [Candidatus Saccharibacteria bacterium]
MNGQIFNFEDGRDKLYKKVCRMATNIGLGRDAKALKLTFAGDNITSNSMGCAMSVFETTYGAILRREWPRDHEVRYNRLVNYDEALRVAPKSIRHMQDNAIQYMSTISFMSSIRPPV